LLGLGWALDWGKQELGVPGECIMRVVVVCFCCFCGSHQAAGLSSGPSRLPSSVVGPNTEKLTTETPLLI